MPEYWALHMSMVGMEMSAKEPSKHNAYFEVIEACEQGGCPICALALASVSHYLDAIMYENVNDPPTRDALLAAGGYCNDHSWQLRAMRASTGTAIIYRDVLGNVARLIAKRPEGTRLAFFGVSRQGGGLLERLSARVGATDIGGGPSVSDPHIGCPACRTRERHELIYLGVLLDHLGETEAARSLLAAGGLCLVHLDQAAAATHDAEALDRLLGIQADALGALDLELGEFLRKHDYRFQHESMGTESDSWIRAIAMVAGQPGIR